MEKKIQHFENVTLEILGKSFVQQGNWLLSLLVF